MTEITPFLPIFKLVPLAACGCASACCMSARPRRSLRFLHTTQPTRDSRTPPARAGCPRNGSAAAQIAYALGSDSYVRHEASQQQHGHSKHTWPELACHPYPSRPSSPADRWLYLLIGPLNLLGWRAPRAASGAPEAHRHTTPASALKQAPHWEPHTHMRRRREDRTLPVHTYNQRTLACKGRGGWVTRDCARLGRWG